MNRDDALRFVDELLTEQRTAVLSDLYDQNETDDTLSDLPAMAELVDLPAVVGRTFDVSAEGTRTLREWASLDQITAIAEQHPLPRLPLIASEGLPCPEWCERPDGHPFEQYDTTARREHVRRFSDCGSSVRLEQIERSPAPATGLSDLGIDPAATVIRVQYGPGQVGYLTAAGARRLAAQLIAAADLHDGQ